MDDFTYDVPLTTADWDLEFFFESLENEGILGVLREHGRNLAVKRKEILDLLERETAYTEMSSDAEDWDLGTSTDGSSLVDLASLDRENEVTPPRLKWSFGSRRMAKSPSHSAHSFIEPPLDEGPGITDGDLEEFLEMLKVPEEQYAAEGWKPQINRRSANMSYRSWYRDPPDGGPTVYQFKMIVYGVPPESARDFFLDEECRADWDDSRVSWTALEEWDENGSQVARWVRKFPLFMRDREYVASRRIWTLEERSCYCVAKLSTHPSAPLRPTPMRVNKFASRWLIAPVAGSKEGGNPVACQMINYHAEDSGVSRNITKMGISRGMWPFVLKMESAMRKYHESGKNMRHLLPVFIIQGDGRAEKEEQGLLKHEGS